MRLDLSETRYLKISGIEMSDGQHVLILYAIATCVGVACGMYLEQVNNVRYVIL